MDLGGTVDPEVQVSISNLISALGGVDTETGVYKLGDEALACLRDLRKWLQNYDAKYDRLEVACAIANATLVTKDIPAILSLWEKNAKKAKDPYFDRIALACLELLVPLTWPIEIIGKEDAMEKFSQSMFLKSWQTRYKQAIITFRDHNVLLAVIKLAATSAMRAPLSSRESRDEGILTLVCSFFRNILAIGNERGQDRALVVTEFKRQKVLPFLLSMASGMGSQFDTQDTDVLEIVYYLVRSVDVQRLYGVELPSEDISSATAGKNLKQMLETEEDMNRVSFKPTRHSRFGTLISLDYGDGDQVSLSGQRGVLGLGASLSEMDGKKRWQKPRVRAVNDEIEQGSFMPQFSNINSDNDAMEKIRTFTNDFLDSSFNPIFSKILRLVERMQSGRITKKTCIIYCYLLGWFIDAERARSKSSSRPLDFQLIGSALSNRSLAIVTKLLSYGLEPGELRSTDLVHTSMYALRQILLTIRDMSYTNDVDLRDIADGMKSRLFYEEQWLTVLSRLPRSAHRKSMAYTCESIALTHIVLKMLDEYSKQHTYLFVKTNRLRRTRNKNKDEDSDATDVDAINDHREAARVTNERKFTFEKFVVKYINDPTISIYERALASFKEVGTETVLQVFSFFRRTFAKTPFKALFYRMSLMRILLELVDRQGLTPKSKAYEVAEEFLNYFVRKFVMVSSLMPSLHIQVNEIMTPADAFYYDHKGQDREKFRAPVYEYTLTSRALRDFDSEKQIAVLVAALIDEDKGPFIKWIEDALLAHENESHERQGFKSLDVDAEKMRAIHADGVLRLLLRSLGLIVHTTQGKVIIPEDIDELALVEKLQWIDKYQRETVEFPSGKTARDYIKRSGEPDPVDFASDDEGEDVGDPSSLLAPLSQKRKSSHKPKMSSHRDQSHSVSSESSRSRAEAKRVYSEAFALDPSDGEVSESDEVAKSIRSVRQRKTILDDDDDDE